MNKKNFTAREIASIVKRYERGEAATAIAESKNCSPGVIYRILRHQDVEVRPKGPVPAER